jgi:hypothetical protein
MKRAEQSHIQGDPAKVQLIAQRRGSGSGSLAR